LAFPVRYGKGQIIETYIMTTLQEALQKLESLGTEKMREFNAKHGVGPNQFGVKMGDIRGVANKIKTDHALALELWDTENIDARFLAILIINPKKALQGKDHGNGEI
jgi:3-methyladenine DNA glycosylase AlkD